MPSPPIDPIAAAVDDLIRDDEAHASPRPIATDPVAASTSAEATTMEFDLSSIARESIANAATTSIGSIAGGQLRVVGFATAAGYIQAIKNGVPARTHAIYLQTLSDKFKISAKDLASLPGPWVQSDLPSGPGRAHQPSETSIFSRPPSERRLIVGEAKAATLAGMPPRTPQAAPTPEIAPSNPSKPTPHVRRPPMRVMAGSAPIRRASAPTPPRSVAATVTMLPPIIPRPARPAPAPPEASPAPHAPPPPSRGSEATDAHASVDARRPDPPQDDAAARFSLLELD